MTASALFSFLYTWVNTVVNLSPVPVRTVKIIQSHQNTPAPTGIYLVISYSAARTYVGRGSSGDVKSTGVQQTIQDVMLSVEVREVNGPGDYLEELAVSIEKQSIRDLFYNNKVALLSIGPVQNLPFNEETVWTKESIIEFQIGAAVEITESPSWIENINYLGTIPASGRSGDHILTNIEGD